MIQLVMASALIIVYLVLYLIFGTIILKLLKRDFSFTWALLIGFFTYYGVFQFVALPMILLLAPQKLLVWSWTIFCALIVLVNLYWCVKVWISNIKRVFVEILRHKSLFLIFFVVIMLQIIYIVQYNLFTYDGVYYIGTVNTAVYTNTMFQYDAYTGDLLKTLNLRYALSTFLMHSSISCKLVGIHPLVEMKVTLSVICILLRNIAIYLAGNKLFKGDSGKSYLLVISSVILTNFFYTMYTQEAFLIGRAFESKSYCANVILPATLLVCLCILDNIKDKYWWYILFIITLSSVTISMSAILSVPCLATAMLVPSIIMEKEWKKILSYILCMLPNIIYIIIYMMYSLFGFNIYIS